MGGGLHGFGVCPFEAKLTLESGQNECRAVLDRPTTSPCDGATAPVPLVEILDDQQNPVPKSGDAFVVEDNQTVLVDPSGSMSGAQSLVRFELWTYDSVAETWVSTATSDGTAPLLVWRNTQYRSSISQTYNIRVDVQNNCGLKSEITVPISVPL